MTPKTIPIYQFKISLNEIRPAIWRRFVVSANITLYELHHIIQIIMGWQNYHLHDFQIDGQIYGDPADDEFGDEYDFGDSWQHTLTLEKILPPDAYKRLPLCLGGNRACPPEDVGGVNG